MRKSFLCDDVEWLEFPVHCRGCRSRTHGPFKYDYRGQLFKFVRSQWRSLFQCPDVTTKEASDYKYNVSNETRIVNTVRSTSYAQRAHKTLFSELCWMRQGNRNLIPAVVPYEKSNNSLSYPIIRSTRALRSIFIHSLQVIEILSISITLPSLVTASHCNDWVGQATMASSTSKR